MLKPIFIRKGSELTCRILGSIVTSNYTMTSKSGFNHSIGKKLDDLIKYVLHTLELDQWYARDKGDRRGSLCGCGILCTMGSLEDVV